MNGKGLKQEQIDEIRELVRDILYPMWKDTIDEIEPAQIQTTARIFAELTGAKWNSPIAIGFTMFAAGIEKGMTLQEDLHALDQRQQDCRA